MGMFDGLFGQVAGNVDLKNLAERIGLSPDEVERGVQALGEAHPQPGDTVQTAAANSGLPETKLQQIVEQIGGESALGRFAALLSEQNGLGGLGSGLLGKG